MHVYITRTSLKRLTDELMAARDKAREAAREVGKAYEGDQWHDNSVWEQAQLHQAGADGRVIELETVLGNHVLIEAMDIDTTKVGVGTVVHYRWFDTGDEVVLTILGPYDSDPEAMIISPVAPLAQAILGKTVGDQGTFRNRALEILQISRWEPTEVQEEGRQDGRLTTRERYTVSGREVIPGD